MPMSPEYGSVLPDEFWVCMVSKLYRKLFFDLANARAFAAEVNFIAQQDECHIAIDDMGNGMSIFEEVTNPFDRVEIGNHYAIDQEKSFVSDNDVYYVDYGIFAPQNSSRADYELARRHAESYLNEKYTELGPDTGRSPA